MKKSIQLIFALLSISALILLGCKKKETVEVDNETQSSVDNAVADQEFSGIVPTVNQHAINTKGAGSNAGKSYIAPCDVLVYTGVGDTTDFMPNPTFTLNMSSAGNTCNPMPDAKARTGTVTVRLTGKIKNVGSQMIIKLTDYKTGTINYTCDSMIVTTEAWSTTMTKFRVQLINGVCNSPSWTIKYQSDRHITNYGNGNPAGTDAVTEIYGTGSGTNRAGLKFDVNIPQASPLIKHKACQYIDKGVLELTPQNFKTRTIDFGDGTCDDNATFTVNGNTVAFKLK